MHTVIIYGASDDLIEVEGQVPGCDEYNAEAGSFIVSSAEASSRVGVHYGKNGCWAVSCGPISEDVPMLIPARFEQDRYTARVVFDGVCHVTHEHMPEEGDRA